MGRDWLATERVQSAILELERAVNEVGAVHLDMVLILNADAAPEGAILNPGSKDLVRWRPYQSAEERNEVFDLQKRLRDS